MRPRGKPMTKDATASRPRTPCATATPKGRSAPMDLPRRNWLGPVRGRPGAPLVRVRCGNLVGVGRNRCVARRSPRRCSSRAGAHRSVAAVGGPHRRCCRLDRLLSATWRGSGAPRSATPPHGRRPRLPTSSSVRGNPNSSRSGSRSARTRPGDATGSRRPVREATARSATRSMRRTDAASPVRRLVQVRAPCGPDCVRPGR
jgi:hypothetical protein